MSEPLVFTKISEFIAWRDSLPTDQKVGLVPTMGALHAGHAELIKKSAAENQVTALTIFVNPTQFNNSEDLQKYPRTWESDLKLASLSGATVVLSPAFIEIYPDNYRYKLSEAEFSTKLCGANRPGHFDGVLTVVMKLLQLARPHKAYFGEKDFQQLQLIADMAKAFFLRTQIVGVPTVRESDGLAMSSRNVRLTATGRELAPVLFKAISSPTISDARALLDLAKVSPEYLEEHHGRRFIAAQIDGVRLIDNVKL